MSSFSSSLRLLVVVDLCRIRRRPVSESARIEVLGTRNLKQDLRSSATLALIDDACCLVPRRESKSETVALGGFCNGDGDCDFSEKKGSEEDDEV